LLELICKFRLLSASNKTLPVIRVHSG
jgi:hypothetical protein